MKLTIFTPTYNRAYIIGQLYESLKKQTSFDFEWLVVDDGSTDETQQLFEKWTAEETCFPIRYYKKENGGKCRAINYALDLAQGELFFTVDSDDWLTEDAVEKIKSWFAQINDKQISGIVANRGYAPNKTENYCFREDYLDKPLLDIYSFQQNGHQVFDGERAFVFYTDFHKKYRYPEFDGENFMTEAVVWNRMARDGYKMRFFNDIIWIFEYRDDGLTKAGNTLFLNNPRGYGLWLREKAEFENRSAVDKFRMLYNFSCELKDRYDAKTIAECIGTKPVIIKCMLALHKAVRFIKRK